MLDAVSIENCRTLIQTLGHSLWQASFVAVLCWLALRSLPARKAGTRYAVTCGGLLVVVFASLLTAATVSTTSEHPSGGKSPGDRDLASLTHATKSAHDMERSQDAIDAAATNDDQATHSKRHQAPVAATHDGHADFANVDMLTVSQNAAFNTAQRVEQSTMVWPAIVAAVWGFGVLAMLFRLIRVIVGLQKLQSSQSTIDDTVLGQLREIIAELSQRMNLRWPVSLVISNKVPMPGIVGTFWPTLLMPPAMLTGIPIEQLRIVIAHELAHARRFDFLVNLGQLLVESLLFFNPAVWWLSRQIRIEREACCDAVAVAATGSAVPVARTLLAIVDRLTESLGSGPAGNFALAAGVQSFGGDEPSEKQTPLFDRVRRIVTPDQRPHIRVPWYTLVGVVVAYVFVSLGVYEGADATVQIVQQALSPKERVEKIEELIASRGDLARSEGVHVYGPNADENQEPAERKEVTVSGIVRTHDGSPLPDGLYVNSHYCTKLPTGNSSSGTAFQSKIPDSAIEHRFEEKVSCLANPQDGTSTLLIYVGHRRDGSFDFAPTIAGPFHLTEDGPPENLELVLKPGFEAHIQVENENGEPIPGAFISRGFFFGVGGTGTILESGYLRADSAGSLKIPNATSDLTWRAHVRAAGYEKERFELKLQPDKPNSIVLKKATPTRLALSSNVKGQGVSAATAYIVHENRMRNGNHHSWSVPSPRDSWSSDYEGRSAPLFKFGPSDGNGEIVLHSLAADSQYDILILAEGFGPMIIDEVGAGQETIEVKLLPEISVTGRIIGDISTLRKNHKTKQPYIQYSNLNNNSILEAAVEERDGVGHFHISGLGHGHLLLRLPDRRVVKNLKESIDDLVVDLSEPASQAMNLPPKPARPTVPEGTTRKVILSLVGADSAVPTKGQLRAGFIARKKPGAYSSQNFEIVNSQVEFDVEVPTKIHWMGKDFVGYSVVRKSEVEVGVGDEPFHADVQLLPAGAVRGEVRLADGSLARKFQTYVLPIERIDGFNNKEVRVDGSDTPGEFLLAGLPLGNEYQALVIDERKGSVASILTEPFRLDEGSPIADLKFQFDEGREHVIQLIDQDGNPAIGAKAGGWFYPTKRFSRSGGFHADENGKIVIRHISESLPGRMELHVKHAAGFVGHIHKLDWNALPEVIKLSRGVSASGRIVDFETGRGIADASFHLYPQPSDVAASRQAIVAKTDGEGNFSFDCLESINYQLSLYGAVAPRVPLVKNRLGVIEPDYSGIDSSTFPAWYLEGGRKEPYVIKVKVVPKRGLKLAPPDSDAN